MDVMRNVRQESKSIRRPADCRGITKEPSVVMFVMIKLTYRIQELLMPIWHYGRSFLRIPGYRLLRNFQVARKEVRLASLAGEALPCRDGLSVYNIPSTKRLGASDRIVAEIDQDGFVFAIETEDKDVFEHRDVFLPRLRYRLQVVVHSGTVCLKKTFARKQKCYLGVRYYIQNRLGVNFYTEAASLLRLRGVFGVPLLRGVDFEERALFMDFIQGETLRSRLIAAGHSICDLDVAARPELRRQTEMEREQRERDLMTSSQIIKDDERQRLKELVLEINCKGVVLLDVKPGNIIIGKNTGNIYAVDFERAQLLPYSGYWAKLDEQFRLFNAWFGLDLWTRSRVDAVLRVYNEDPYSPVDLGSWGQLGDTSDVEVGDGRWRWLLKTMTDWTGKRMLDLGSNNCILAIRACQAGAAHCDCVEMSEAYYAQAQFVRAVIEQSQCLKLPITIHNMDMKDFLTSRKYEDEAFDITLALCSIYYLDRDDITSSLKIIARISKECWLQANIGTKRESDELLEKASVEFLQSQLIGAGFDQVHVIAPKGYSRPLLIGRKSKRNVMADLN